MQGNPAILRIALLLVAAALIPACGSSGGGALLPGGGGTTLFANDFSVFPDAAAWTVTAGGGAVAQDLVNGSPGAPSVSLTGGNNDTPSITAVGAFTTPSLTISARIALQAGGTKGTGSMTITETGGPTVAFMQWDSATGATVFNIDGNVAAGPVLAADGAFHTVVFSVDAAGNATINLDGGATEVGPFAWPAALAGNTLTLGATIPAGPGTPAVFNFDTVTITSP